MLPLPAGFGSGRRPRRRSSLSSLRTGDEQDSFRSTGGSLFSGGPLLPELQLRDGPPSLTLPPLRSDFLQDPLFSSPSRRSATQSKRQPNVARDSIGLSNVSLDLSSPFSRGTTFNPSPLPPLSSLSASRNTFQPLASEAYGYESDVSYGTDQSFGTGLGGFPMVQMAFKTQDEFFAFAKRQYVGGVPGVRSTPEKKVGTHYVYCFCRNRRKSTGIGCKWQISAKLLSGVGGFSEYKLFTDYQVHSPACLENRRGTGAIAASGRSARTVSRRPSISSSMDISSDFPSTSRSNIYATAPLPHIRDHQVTQLPALSSAWSTPSRSSRTADERTQSAIDGLSMLSTISPSSRLASSPYSSRSHELPSLSMDWSTPPSSSQPDWLSSSRAPGYGQPGSIGLGTGRRRRGSLSRMASSPFLSSTSSPSAATSSGSYRKYSDWSAETQSFIDPPDY